MSKQPTDAELLAFAKRHNYPESTTAALLRGDEQIRIMLTHTFHIYGGQ